MRHRRLLLLIALGAVVIIVLTELGVAVAFNPAPVADGVLRSTLAQAGVDPGDVESALAAGGAGVGRERTVGLAIPALALLDGLTMAALAGMAFGIVNPGLQGKVVAPSNLVVSFVIVIVAVASIVTTLALIGLMISLLLAAPFGTITYFVRWGFFPRSAAQGVLAAVLLLRLVTSGCLVAAMPRVRKQVRLLAMMATGYVAHFLVAILHALVPLPLVSITDAVAAIVVAIMATGWALVVFLWSTQGLARLVRP